MMAEHLERILESRGFGSTARSISLLGQSGVKIISVLADEKLIPPGVSKFGGTPHVPIDFEWPIAMTGAPLSFLAQINFAEFGPFQWMGWKVPVPESGVVSFFVDLTKSNKNSPFKVFHFPDAKILVRWEDPFAIDSPAIRLAATGAERIDLKATSFPPRSLAFRQFLSLPMSSESPLHDLNLSPRVSSEYRSFALKHNQQEGTHQMLGWPWGSEPAPPGNALLLQLGNDRSLGWTWNEGLPQFFVPETDFAESRFDRVTFRWAH
jgi:hypothetical protein